MVKGWDIRGLKGFLESVTHDWQCITFPRDTDREPVTDLSNHCTRFQLGEFMNLLELLTRSWVTQRQLHHQKAHPSMGEGSQKLYPWSGLYDLEAA